MWDWLFIPVPWYVTVTLVIALNALAAPAGIKLARRSR